MMAQVVTPPDLELFLTRFIRERMGVETDVRQPSDWRAIKPLVVIRDDGGPMAERLVFQRTLGVTVHAGVRADVVAAGRLARRVFSLLSSDAVVSAGDSPISSVLYDGFNGPYRVTEQHDCSTWYFTASYLAVGEVLVIDDPA